MSRLAQILKAKSELTQVSPETAEIVAPMLDQYARELQRDDAEFIEDRDGFRVDGVLFRKTKGLGYILALIKKPGRQVAATDLSMGVVGEGEQELADRETFRQVLYDKKELEWKLRQARHDPPRDDHGVELVECWEERLRQMNDYLNTVIYQRQSKSFTNERERCRQRVTKAISLALKRLRDHPETADIGAHLTEQIRTGHNCIYLGGWKWRTRKFFR